MPLQMKSTAWSTIEELKEKLKSLGYTSKAILDDSTMEKADKLISRSKGYYKTPERELRYMEGLLSLPLGYIDDFGVIHAEGHEKCTCGRVPSALDVVVTALKRGIHGRELIRDTLIGLENVFELAEGAGREAQCINCGRPVLLARYSYKKKYRYA